MVVEPGWGQVGCVVGWVVTVDDDVVEEVVVVVVGWCQVVVVEGGRVVVVVGWCHGVVAVVGCWVVAVDPPVGWGWWLSPAAVSD